MKIDAKMPTHVALPVPSHTMMLYFPNPQVYYDALLRLVNLVLPYAILCPRAVLCVLVRPCVSSCSLARSCVIKFSVPQKTLVGIEITPGTDLERHPLD